MLRTGILVALLLMVGLATTGERLTAGAETPARSAATSLCDRLTSPSERPFGPPTRLCGSIPPSGSAASDGAVSGSAGSIEGSVTEEGTGSPLEGICVAATDFTRTGHIGGVDETDASGDYIIGGLPPAQYSMIFADCNQPDFHVTERYDARPFDSGIVDLVEVSSGQATTGIDAELSPGGGGISGTVSDPLTGLGAENVCVIGMNAQSDVAGFDITDTAGAYMMGGLTGDIAVLFTDCAEPARYVDGFYNGALIQADADLVNVSAGGKVGGIDATMTRGAMMNGTVRSAGVPVAGVCVAAFARDGELVETALTQPDGTYTVAGLPPGDTQVVFVDCNSPAMYITEWYADQPTFFTATDVTIGAAGTKRSGVNADLARGGTISGTVTESGTGNPLSLVCVDIFEVNGPASSFPVTDAEGRYASTGLPAGPHRVRFRDCADPATHPWEWHSDRPDYNSANNVPVAVGSDRTVNAVMARGAGIAGTARNVTGSEVLTDVCVDVFDSEGMWRGTTATDAKGEYAVGLTANTTRYVWFTGCNPSDLRLAEWWRNKPDFFSADDIGIGSVGGVTVGIDASLGPTVLGDASCDARVNAIDAAFVLQFTAGLLFGFDCYLPADVNRDGRIDALDAALILQYSAGIIDEF